MSITPPSNHPESDALWQPEPLAVPSPHYTHTFADNYREDEYKFACRMEEKCREAVALLKIQDKDLFEVIKERDVLRLELETLKLSAPYAEMQSMDRVVSELTNERDSLKEQLEKEEQRCRDAYVLVDQRNQQIYELKETNQSLITQRNLDTECIERLQTKGAENEVKIEEQVAQMAVMVGALKLLADKDGVFRSMESWDGVSIDIQLNNAITNAPLAAKDLLERVNQANIYRWAFRNPNRWHEIFNSQENDAKTFNSVEEYEAYLFKLAEKKALSTIKQP